MPLVLYQPQIPQNAGNIVRLCAVTGQSLIMVKPLGFSVSDRMLKRAGLDYWEGVDVQIIDSLEEYLAESTQNFYFFSSHAERSYTEVSYQENDLLIFGSETQGLPQHYFEKYPERFLTLPMVHGKRCLNLSNAAAIVTYESWRQREWSGRATAG